MNDGCGAKKVKNDSLTKTWLSIRMLEVNQEVEFSKKQNWIRRYELYESINLSRKSLDSILDSLGYFLTKFADQMPRLILYRLDLISLLFLDNIYV